MGRIRSFYRLVCVVFARIQAARSTGTLFCTVGFICLLSTPASAAVIINEFMASNDSTLVDEDGQYSDWIELYNNGNSAVDVSNWYLTDDQTDLKQWQFPATSIAAGDYLVVFASGMNRVGSGSPLHTNFKLSSGGEYLALVLADGLTLADSYSPQYPQQFTDISFGGAQYFNEPTPGRQNNAGVDGVLEDVEFSLEHGFYNTPQTLNLSTTTANSEIRYSLDGSIPSSQTGCTPPVDGSAWQYEYYQGSWSVLPNFDALTPISTGTTNTISTAPKQQEDFYALRFKGCIEATKAGLYRFSTTSDDGSQLFINGQLVVDNDGLHGAQTVSSSLLLEKGLHPVVVTMFEQGGGDVLSAQWSSPTRSNAYVTSSDNGIFISDPLSVANSQNSIEFEFDLPTSGQFSFDTRIQGLNDNSNSFWVQIDNGTLWLFDTTISTGIINQMLSDRNSGVISQTLSAGTHRLRFYLREDGSVLDSVTVLGTNCDGPCEPQLLEAESASFSGSFYAAGSTTEPLQGSRWLTYTNPISIDSSTTVRAVAYRENFLTAKPVTQSYLFVNDIISQSINEQAPAGWPSGPINGQDLDYGMDPQIVNSNPQAVKDSLTSLPAVSIVTDLDNLLHPELGIYVNAQNKGRYWERPVSVELIDPNGLEAGFTVDAGLRIRGGFSRIGSNPKHAFRLFFRGRYSGDLEYPLFGNEGADIFQKVDLRTSQNYSWSYRGDNRNTFLREVWSRDTQGAMGHVYTKSRYYHLYINTIYWGIYMTQERVSKEFASSYFGGSEDNYDVVKHNRSDNFRYEATDGTNSAWNTLWNYVSDQQINSAEYAAILQNVDIESLIDYILINAYEGDTDGSPSAFLNLFKRSNNWYAIFDRTDSNSKWTFYQHDGEHTLGVRRMPDLEENLLGPYPPYNSQSNEFFSKDYFNPYLLHGALAKNSDYRQKFIDRSALHFAPGGALSTAQALSRWNQRKQQVSSAILAESARWGDSKTSTPFNVNDWQTEVDYAENSFFSTRSNIVFNQLIAQGLASSMPVPEFSIPSGSVIEPGTVISISNTTSDVLYYTLDGSDPRLPGGGISPSAFILMPGQSLTINADVNITIRYYNGSSWGPVSNWIFSVNAIPVIETIQNQINTNGQTVNLTLLATDDDLLTWSATNLPNGLTIDRNTGEIAGTLDALGNFAVTVTVDDGAVTADASFNWWVVPKARLILNEYNAVSGSKYLGGGDNTVNEPADSRLGRIVGNGGDWFELVVIEDHLDIRGWQLSLVDDGNSPQVLTFSNSGIWSDLRAGTIITVSENAITASTGDLFNEDISYSPETNDWWIHVVTGNGGSGSYISVQNISISNKDWQLEILDSAGQTVFGPVGEGVGNLGGVNSEEVGKLETDPQPYINPGSEYNDGASSSFGEPNLYNGGTQTQDFNALRSVISADINLSVADTAVNENNPDVGVVVSVSQASTEDISFQIMTVNNSAVAGLDYTTVNKIQTIPAGELQTTVLIPLINDNEIETTESFRVVLSNAINARITDGNGSVTIMDDDTGTMLPILSIADASAVEGKYARFALSLSEPALQAVSFSINTVDGTATGTSDYRPASGSRSIAAGDVGKTIWILTSDDADLEADETFTLELSNVDNAALGDGIGLGIIVNNDVGVDLPSLGIADTMVVEGKTAKIFITLSQPAPADVIFRIDTVDQTANGNSDFSHVSGNRVIAAGETQKTIWIPIAQDTEVEGSETFILQLSNVRNAVLNDASGLITIVDDDMGQSLPTLSVASTSIFEGRNARFVLSLSEPATAPVSFMFTTVDGSASAGTDYVSNSGVRRFNVGESEKSIWAFTVDDSQFEPNETFTLQISNISNALLGGGVAQATIINNDTAAGAPNLSIADATVVEGSIARCILTLSAPSNQDVIVGLASSDQTATATLDYTSKNGNRTIKAGETELTIWIPINDDTETESNETFTLDLISAINAVIVDSSGTITILDND